NWCGDPNSFIVRMVAGQQPQDIELNERPTCIEQAVPPTTLAYRGVPTGAPPSADPRVRTEIDGIPVQELTLGQPRPLPDGLVLHYSVSCYECDGGWDPHRAYVDGDGTLIREWLREPIIAASGVDG